MAEEIKNVTATTEATEEQELTVEELREVLKAKGLDIGDLARQAKALKKAAEAKTEDTTTAATTTIRKKKEGPEFELVLANYPDIVIEKRMATTTKRMMIMPSCGGYYIKTINKKGEDSNAELLNREGYSKFTSGMEDIKLPDGYWTKAIMSGQVYYDNMMKVLEDGDLVKLIKARALPETLNVESAGDKYSSFGTSLTRLRSLENKNLYVEFKDDEKALNFIKGNAEFINDIIFEFGLNNARDFLNELKLSLVHIRNNEAISGSYYYSRGNSYTDPSYVQYTPPLTVRQVYKSSRPQMKMDYKRFKEYVLYESVFMGYAENMSAFFSEWNDSLKMEYDIYGKIKEKYSTVLPMHHAQLSYKSQIAREYIDINKFKHHHDKIQELFEATVDDMIYKVPERKEEMISEATQQANCLASYVQRFANEESMIVFMRKKETPEESLVTIEVLRDSTGNMFINQAYQARNHMVTHEQYENIKEWADKRKIDISRIHYND